MAINEWQSECEVRMRQDHEELIQGLAELNVKADNIQRAQAEQSQQLAERRELDLQLMSLLQRSLGAVDIANDAHARMQQNLLHLQLGWDELLPDMELKHGEVKRVGTVRAATIHG
jgi:hypothetical protein